MRPSTHALSLSVGAMLLAAATGALMCGHGKARAASFNCAKAASPTELAICSSPALSALDAQLGAAWAQRVARDPGLRPIERGWIAVRDVGCGKDVRCLTRMTRARLAWLKSGAPMPTALPRTPGTCSASRIKAVGYRLGDGIGLVGDSEGSGSMVVEANGAQEVFYDQIPDMDHSRAGDAALVCLIDLPHDCPPGDVRGKVYGVANLRTGGAWSGPDSEHLCGGA